MIAKDLRELSKEELIKKREDIRAELFNLKFRAATTQNENPMRPRLLRRDIARIETILREQKD